MAQTPEAKVKARVKKILVELGAYHFFPMTGGYGHSGIPDIICCLQGKFIGIECKTDGNKPTALQLSQLQTIRDCGGLALVVNEDSIDKLKESIQSWVNLAQTKT
jgi:hypothetical protein